MVYIIRKNENFELRVYIDVDWAGNNDDRKRTSDGLFFLEKKVGYMD